MNAILESPIFHNPDNLSTSLLNSRAGWRLLQSTELNTIPAYPKNDESLEIWDTKHQEWDVLCDFHHHSNRTYRTKRPM